MAVQYVKDFTFAPSPPRPTIRGYARGGHVTPCYASGGKVATGKIPSAGRNPNDAVSPGSPVRTPMGQKDSNASAAKSKFATAGRGTPPATQQSGSVQRMTGYSDFKKGGPVKRERIHNLGHYAHGGKVKASGEKSSGSAGSGKVAAPVKKAPAATTERKSAPGSRVEMKSGTAKAAMGGLSRATSPKKNAAIHAKSAHKAPKGAGLAQLAGALSGMGMPHQAPQAPPGMAPGMGAPPGGPMGGMAPQAPVMGGGPPAMAAGGSLHVVHSFR